MLRAQNLECIRNDMQLFSGLDFSVKSGELLQVVGPNGSGKTSLMRAIAGMLNLQSGEVFWNGEPVSKQRQVFHGSMVWLAHRNGLKGDLTLVENLEFEKVLRPQSALEPEHVFERLDVARLKRLPVRSLSAGQQRRVALARMLLAEVPLWLLDEPFTNLDKEGRQLVLEITEEHLASGGLCVMAGHQEVELAATVKKVCL